jgi:hypothetical protein
MGPFSLSVCLGHIRPRLGLAVVVRPIAVVDVARRIHPHQARSAARRLRHRRSLRRRRRLRGRSRHRTRSWNCNLWRCRSWRCHRTWCSHRDGGCRRSLRRCCRSLRIPLLHALMATARPLFAGSRRVSPVFTLTGGSCGRLSHRNLPRQNPHRNRHQTNRYLHKKLR